MSTHNGTLDTDPRMTFAREPTQAGFALDEERILDADEIAAELVPDALAEPCRAPRPPEPRNSAGAFGRFGAFEFSAANSQRPAPPSPRKPVVAVKPEASGELHAIRLELARLQSQMRARDAYLAELERALDASSRQLSAAGLANVEDAYALLGRVRGQAFRIAELESELRHARQARSRLPAPARTQATHTQTVRTQTTPSIPPAKPSRARRTSKPSLAAE